jgi:phage terminase large subunit-like protein
MGLRGRNATTKKDRQELRPGTNKGGHKHPWDYKKNRADKVISFLEHLPITKGILAGHTMELLDEQKDFIREMYGNLKPDGLRLRNLGVLSVAKGNGKTGMIAGLVLCHLVGPEAEDRGEVYSAAIDREQAAIIFRECVAIIEDVPWMRARINIQRYRKILEVISGKGKGSTYEALSADARRAHGLAPSLFIYDELAQAKTRELLDNLINGLGKRKEALGLVISTQARDDTHALSQLIDNGLTGMDDSTYVRLLAAPEDADIFSEKVWKEVNPALGKYLSLEELRSAARRAQLIPSFEASFRNLRLNQRVDSKAEDRLITADVWKLGAKPIRDLAKLRKHVSFAALDLASKNDLAALVLFVPDAEVDPSYDIIPFFWTPEGSMARRSLKEQELFKEWIRRGYLTSVPGPTIPFRFIAKKLIEIERKYNLTSLAYDRWRMDEFKVVLSEEDPDFELVRDAKDNIVGGRVELVPFGQGFVDMGPAVDWFVELALMERLRHANHPVLTASISGAILVSDPAGNKKIEKAKSMGRGPVRVDGAVASVMAAGIAKLHTKSKPTNLSDFLKNLVAA